MGTQTIETAPAEDTPVTVDPATTTTATEPPVGDTPAEPAAPEEPVLSDEQVDALVASLLAAETIPTEPQFFTKEKEEKIVNDLVIIDQLVTKQAQEQIAREDAETKNAEAVKLLEEIQKTADEKQKEIDAVNSLYSNIETILTPEVAKALALNDTENIPLYFIKENMDRVVNHPFVGPLVASLLAGNEVELLKIVKDAIAKNKSSLPNVANISSPEKIEPTIVVNPMDDIVGGLIHRHKSI